MGFPPFSNALFILENTKGVVRAKWKWI
jgi:hypothetical protein